MGNGAKDDRNRNMPAGTMTKIKILIVDDLEHVRQGLRTILQLADDLEVVGEASDGLEAIQLAGQLEPDVVLIDLEMPQLDGLEATQRIKNYYPHIGVVMITIHDDASNRERAARVGVDAFVEKGIAFEVLLKTIRQVSKRHSPKGVSP
jgi:DNA-binding NarL/FixJ family response regulator